MKKLFPVLLAASLAVVALPVQAEDTKVVVVPMAADSGGPGDWKHVSVSSLGGIPRNSATRTGVKGASADYACGDIGRYAEEGGFEYLTVPIQLPDGATIIGFTGLICDTTDLHAGRIMLMRSDFMELATTSTNAAETNSTTLTKTTSVIKAGCEVVDNSKYSYFVYMGIDGNAGSALYPVSAIVTLQ